jgi:hypothetical protein
MHRNKLSSPRHASAVRGRDKAAQCDILSTGDSIRNVAKKLIGGTLLARRSVMRILLASLRADPCSDSSAPLVVAYIYFERHGVTIEPVHSALAGTQPITMLRQLIEELGGRDPFANLVGLRVREWSFDVPAIH